MNWDVFKKPGVESKPEPRKESGKSNPGKAEPQPGNREPPATQRQQIDMGQDIDPNALPDDEKQSWAYTVQNYTGQQDPQQWSMYHSQKAGLNLDAVLRAANVIRNTCTFYNAPTIEQVPEPELRKFPWWSAFRNFDVNSNPVFNKGTWSPSKSILGATMGNRFMG